VTTQESWTIGRLLEWTTKFLAEKGSESPRLDTEVLLAQALDCKRIELYTRHDEEPAEANRTKFRDLIRQRIEGCPVAYLVGRKEFFSLELEVNRSVLIPRPDSECVVDECLRLARTLAAPRVLDIGTGSGNLAVAVARQHKTADVTAVDISPEALAVAERNAAKHGVAVRMRFLQGDLFGALAAEERFDFVLSNPPYIPHDDIAKLEPGVRDYEPHTALDGGRDGFGVFDRLVAESPRFLQTGGYLIIEIGSPQEQHARERIEAHGSFELAKTVYDGSGHPRVLKARLRPV
jgi:release factor glutamine methyltransferase